MEATSVTYKSLLHCILPSLIIKYKFPQFVQSTKLSGSPERDIQERTSAWIKTHTDKIRIW